MKIAIVDIETTGFLNQGGSIVEIGVVELDLSNGEIKEVYNSLCKEGILDTTHRAYLDYQEKGLEPPRGVKGWIFGNSDLHPDQLRAAPSFEKVKAEVQEVFKQYPAGVTAYNNRFDFGFLENRGIEIGKKLPCPMLLSTDICQIPNVRGGNKWPKVEEAYKFFFPKSEYIELHRGADDAKHEAEIVYELFKLGEFIID